MCWSGAEKRGERAGLHALVRCGKKRRVCRLACFGGVQKKEETIQARMREREREKGTEGECTGMYGVPSILVLINSQA